MPTALQGFRKHLAVLSAATTTGALLILPSVAAAGPLSPESPVSPNAEDTTLAYWVMLILASVIALAAIAALLRAMRGSGDEPGSRTVGTRSLQTKVGIGLGLIAAAVFVFGIVVTESAREIDTSGTTTVTDSGEPLEIEASGQMWLWRFQYPRAGEAQIDGQDKPGVFSYEKLVVPVDTPVILDVKSIDVDHTWWVPALGPQVDAIPGSSNETWFRADEIGIFRGQSTTFAGPATATMRATVQVVSQDDYKKYISSLEDALENAQAESEETYQEEYAPSGEEAEVE